MLQEKFFTAKSFFSIKKKNIEKAEESFLLSITINPSQSMNS